MEALRLMHTDVARNCKVEDLACVAGMSRPDFALRFKEHAGLPSLDYLIRWRIHLARQLLRRDGAIAQSLGRASESAFYSAFKRMFALSEALLGAQA